MDRQKMLQEIKEKIADKTLSFGCRIKSKAYGYVTLTEIFDCTCDDILQYKRGEKAPHGEPLYLRYKLYSGNVGLDDIEEIIGHPISLSRVLSALGHGYWYDFSNQMIMFMKDSFIDGIYWYLLKEDKSDAMLDDQSDETIKAIREIICKCDHVGDGVAYMTNPAQYKCKKCGEMFK